MLKGGEIPGISRNVLDRIVKQYMERLYYAAAKEQGQSPMDVLTDDSHKSFDSSKYLLPLTELPLNMVTSVISGESLPYLTKEQTQTVKVSVLILKKKDFIFFILGLLHSANSFTFRG